LFVVASVMLLLTPDPAVLYHSAYPSRRRAEEQR
jgi:hypothetical protein